MTEFIRTPETRFLNLDNFPYTPSYIQNLKDSDGARLSYIDEQSDSKETALFLHGNPTWSYCYRKMIPIMLESGFRAIAPDMIGFGRSDKPIYQQWHTFEKHINILRSFIETLDLTNITLICHDWGGMFGLNLVPSMPHRFKRIIALNTMLCTGDIMPEIWYRWLAYSNGHPNLDPTECLIDCGCTLTRSEISSFLAPYPNALYKAAFRQFPNFIPDRPERFGAQLGQDSVKFWQQHWQGESFVAIGMMDEILRNPTNDLACKVIRGCPTPMRIESAGHFLFEWGDQVLQEALKSFDLK